VRAIAIDFAAMDLAPEAAAAPAKADPAIDAAPPADAGLDRAVLALADRARAFARTPAREKAALLRAIVPRLVDLAPALAAAIARARGLDPEGPAAVEPWIAGVAPAVAYTRQLAESLEDIAASGRPALPAGEIRKRDDGIVVARLTPRGWAERMAARGRDAMVLFTAGTQPEDVIAGQAAFYRQSDPEGGVALVIADDGDPTGGLLDALFALFVEGHVALLATSDLASLIERALAPLCDAGFLRVVTAGEDERLSLASHPAVARVLFAGPSETHEKLVAGGKSVDAILGGVSPLVVVPCLYAKDELVFVAESVAAALAHDGAFDGTAPRVLVLPGGWAQRGLFLDLLKRAFAALPPRVAGPQAAARFAALTAGREDAIRIGEAGGGALPWTILPALDPAAPDPIFAALDPCGSLIAEVFVGTDDPVEMLAAATSFCNERLGGSLAAQIVLHPVHEDDPAVVAAVERAVIELRYGAVGINRWPAAARWGGVLPWGAHPSGTVTAPRSGRGFRNDARMLPRVDKAVVKGPLLPVRRPLHLSRDGVARRLAEQAAAFQAAPSARHLWGLMGR
jgi:acyl-CoA reductase-like NAD-dependent aldehyde dehydrogenase